MHAWDGDFIPSNVELIQATPKKSFTKNGNVFQNVLFHRLINTGPLLEVQSRIEKSYKTCKSRNRVNYKACKFRKLVIVTVDASVMKSTRRIV